MNSPLRRALRDVAHRIRQFRLWMLLALCWGFWAIVCAVLRTYTPQIESQSLTGGPLLATLFGLMIASALACVAIALRSARNDHWIARRIEADNPELGTGLLAAVEEDAKQSLIPSYLQSVVIRDALIHRNLHQWERLVPNWMLRGSKLLHAIAFVCLLLMVFSLFGATKARRTELVAAAARAKANPLTIEPGDAEIERGTPLIVTARFGASVPAEATLVADFADDESSRRSMTRHLEDPLFAGRVEAVDRDLTYRIEYDGHTSKTFKVTTFEYPRVVRVDADLVFPSYTSLPPKTVEDVRHVTAVEGTEVTLKLRLNKDVTAATLSDKSGKIELTSVDEEQHVYAATIKLASSRKLAVALRDAAGRANKIATQVSLNVLPNRPPTVVASVPAHDVRVSPIEELSLKAKIADDFGVARHGVTYMPAGEDAQEVVLDGPAGKESRFDASHLLNFETFKSSPDELVTYYFWAEDVGPDGEPRRVSGDMFFAEVRPFEEIFRQGEQPAGGQQANQQQQGGNSAGEKAMELAEMQKQIINATWKVVRRETISKPTEQLAPDSTLIAESQRTAIEQAKKLAEELQSPESGEYLQRAISFMTQAADGLEKTAASKTAGSLQSSLSAEQAAYQALLKLRDREFNVTQNQSRQQSARSASAGSPSQRQLQQLELTNEENRYEERSAANDQPASPEEEAQREMRQVLSRLSELAHRQEDLNERLKEMQAALEAAQDEETRKELERQLKRLREQQQEILRDTDELRERMEQEQNREQLADARQAVEESREHVRQASEALEEGRVSQALTEGTRAERQLEETSEELRSQSANQLAEQMQGLRDAARQLDEKQKEITQSLEALAENETRSLRQTEDRDATRQELEQQREDLDRLVEQLQETVQQTEDDEPLVAEELFEAAQRVAGQSVPQALEAAQQLNELGVPAEAAKASKHAGEALEQLREDVERAGASLLGDETEALRRARDQLDDLADQIDRELPTPMQGENQQGENQQGENQQGENQQGQNQQGQNQQGQNQQGQNQQGQNQQGQNQQGQNQQGQNQQGQNQQGQNQQGQNQQGQNQQGQNQQGQSQQGQSQQGQSQQGQNQQGQNQQGQNQQGQNQQGQSQQGQSQQGQSQQGGGGERRDGERPRPGGLRDAAPTPNSPSSSGGPDFGGLEQMLNGASVGSPGGPITGEGFREWSDRMRDVEELVNDPELRAEAARIRDRVRGARRDFVRHSKEPDPKALQEMVAEPIRELRRRVAEEVRKRENPDALVPIDRDPVPPSFAEDVRRYYERLGSGQ